MADKDLIFALVLSAALILSVFCWRMDRRMEKLKKLLANRESELRMLLEQLRAKEEKKEKEEEPSEVSFRFSEGLEQASLKQRLKGGDVPGKIPEKYRLVTSMAERGIDAEDISEILEISLAETQQLINLANVTSKKN